MRPQDIRIEAFDYPLPPERIARHPLEQRDACRLLVAPAGYDAAPEHRRFGELPGLLEPGTLLVRNNTRVIPARLLMRKPTGGGVEIFLLDPAEPAEYVRSFESRGQCEWMCLVGNLKRWHEGKVSLEGVGVHLDAEKLSAPDAAGLVRVRLGWKPADLDFATLLELVGRIPIPPYLERDTEDSDATDYQTVYSRIRGSVAAPTAGLHFTPGLFAELERRGVEVRDVTLHVGAGTFKPVKSETMAGHEMHTERFSIGPELLESLVAALKEGRKIVAVGTTSVRTLESLPLIGAKIASGLEPHISQWEPYSEELLAVDTLSALESLLAYIRANGELRASTALMIAPGFHWRLVGGMVTNFHQPKSTLLLLVSAFLERHGGDGLRWRRLYDQALAIPGYRFLSYGDACLLS